MSGNLERDLLAKLDGKLSDEDLKTVLNELRSCTIDYDIQKRDTNLMQYDGMIPDIYKAFIVSKRIEGLSDSTLKTYNYCLVKFFQNIGKSITEITVNDIRFYLLALQENSNMGNRTLDSQRIILNSFFSWCYKEEYRPENPVSRVEPFKYEIKLREPLTDYEMEMIRDACRDYKDRAIIEVLYSTGCRISELMRLKLTDIDYETKEVHLFGKGRKHRISYLNAKAEFILKKYIENERKGDSEYIFVSDRKPYTPIKMQGLQDRIRKIGKLAGLNKSLYAHRIRHTVTSDAANRGMPIPELQQMLGHVKISTTMIYAHISQENVKHDHKKYII